MVSVEWKSKPPFPVFYAFDPDNDGSRIAVTTADSIAFRLLTGANDLFHKEIQFKEWQIISCFGLWNVCHREAGSREFYLDYNAVMRKFWNDTRKITTHSCCSLILM